MPPPRTNTQLLGRIAALVFLAIVVSALVQSMLDQGYIPHKANIKFSMAGNWLDNESRTCLSGYVYDERKRTYSAQTLSCPTEAFADAQHDLPVTFYGKVHRGNPHDLVYSDGRWIGDSQWRCVKHSDGFTCYAID